MDILGEALLDFQNGNYIADIKTYSSLEEEDVLPLPHLFRDFEQMPPLEQKALKRCKGKVLDIGAGAGSHSLYLQQKGIQVTALDSSKGAIQTCKLRGIKNRIQSDIFDFNGQSFDTLLLLMNGIGIAGTLRNLAKLLQHLRTILNDNGQLLLDSSDIIYMFDEDEDGGRWLPSNTTYYGEVTFTMEYKTKKGKPFNWLYIDYNTLQRAASANDFDCELVSEGNHYDYLASLRPKKH